jgi:serine/threonine-protein kinase
LVFFTMEYVEGETLAQRVYARGPLPVGEATRILHDVARAVGYAHARGVIHRDLKPDNIMIEDESGRVMVMDFGIAQVQSQPGSDPSGYVIGTAPFVSPEQVKGGQGDERSDVYALGVTAYYAVTGELPFYGETVEEIFLQHLTEQAPLLDVLGRNLDVTYSRAVACCLSKDPGRRFASGEELAAWLARAPELRRGDLPVEVRGFVERLNRLSESSRGVSVLAAGALIAVIGGVLSASWTVSAWAVGLLGVLATIASLAPRARSLRGPHALRGRRRTADSASPVSARRSASCPASIPRWDSGRCSPAASSRSRARSSATATLGGAAIFRAPGGSGSGRAGQGAGWRGWRGLGWGPGS